MQSGPKNNQPAALQQDRVGAGRFCCGNAAGAIAAYRRALELTPRYVDALNNLAAALDSTQQWNEAIQIYQHATALDPSSLDRQTTYAAALGNAGRAEEAIAQYRKIVAENPDDAHGWFA